MPGVEVLMEQHQNRKVEIDAREDSFEDVVKMGKDLIARDHYATPEVKYLSFHGSVCPSLEVDNKLLTNKQTLPLKSTSQ